MKKLFTCLLILVFSANFAQAQEKIITGTVTDGSGGLLPGVTIQIKGQTKGTTTDFDGLYSLNVTGSNITLIFSYVGFTSQEIVIGTQTKIDVSLKESESQLDEVVLVGFAKQKKVSVVGAVSTVNPGELKLPSSNLTQSFAGRVSGVVSVQRSGEPGKDAAQFWIRGVATFGNSNPLVFLDGIEISLGDLGTVDPTNIQNFSILKDASATAVYRCVI